MDVAERIAARRISINKAKVKSIGSDKVINPLPIGGRFLFSSFEEEVHHWGSENPWGSNTRLPPIRHMMLATEVSTDKRGNVLSMPPLIGRPCFGRIETFLRHAKPAEQTKIVRNNREVASRTKCMGCAVRGPCKALVAERIHSSLEIKTALVAWYSRTMIQHGKRIYTGPVGRLWTIVLKSIVNQGQFNSSNDAIVRVFVADTHDRLKEKWRQDKRRQRNSDLGDGLPDKFTLECVNEERDDRYRSLLTFCQGASAPRDMRRWNAATCSLVSNTWLAVTTLKAERRRGGSTAVARWLIANERSDGRGERALITRVGQDMKKIKRVEHLSVWGPFDPLGHRYDAELNRVIGELQQAKNTPFKKP